MIRKIKWDGGFIQSTNRKKFAFAQLSKNQQIIMKSGTM